MRKINFNKTYAELKRKDQRRIDTALKSLRFCLEQAEDGAWVGALVKDHKASCKCESSETIIVSCRVETITQTVCDTDYYAGDYRISTGREPLGAPVSFVVDIPVEIERAFMSEAKVRVFDQTWRAASALSPALMDEPRPDDDDVRAANFGSYAPRGGAPIRLL